MESKANRDRITLDKEGLMTIEDPVTFEVLKNSMISYAREMSLSLQRTAFSPNIKERRDCSCAIFDSKGNLIAQSKDIPVHLGAMPLSVKSCIDRLGSGLSDGEMVLHNDPFTGGSHLPDLTLVAPVFDEDNIVAYVANRAHHADVGGVSPGSMPGMAESIEDEGVLISPRVIVRAQEIERDAISDLLESTMTPEERMGDLSAQLAANIIGRRRLNDLAREVGWSRLDLLFEQLQSYSEDLMDKALSKFGDGTGIFTDYMDSDGMGQWNIPISIEIKFGGAGVVVDFKGTSRQVEGNVNCPYASTISAVYFVFIALFGRHIPTNEGCWKPIKVKVPKKSLLNPEYPAAVSAGNVETTQRIVDTVIGAISRISPDIAPAASQGTMNNLTIGGRNPINQKPFSFYETLGGGVGASKGRNGASAIHSHMTNTLNTPIESLESEYPLRVLEYSIRQKSGGNGKWAGGDGLVREIEILGEDCTISIQSERRHKAPWGVAGGNDGARGRNFLTFEGDVHVLQCKTSIRVPAGTIVRIETPGGGGWGLDPSIT
jgi:N-methylhydantoinase B